METSDARKARMERESTTPSAPDLHAALRALASRVEAEGDIAARPGQMASLYAIAEDITDLCPVHLRTPAPQEGGNENGSGA